MSTQATQINSARPRQRGLHNLNVGKILLFLVMLYLLVPLAATLVISFTGSPFSVKAYSDLFTDSNLWTTLLLSLGLGIGSTILTVVLITPTAYWVQLRIPRARPLIDLLTLLPFAVPPIVLSLGYLEVYGDSHTWISILSLGLVPLLSNDPFNIVNTPQLLICAYVIIALPFAYRPIDNSLRALNTRVLAEAASSLGCGWWRTFLTIIIPNILPGIISAALLTFTTAMGEFTLASLSGIYTFSVYLDETGQNDPYKAAALTIVSFIITLLCVLALIFLARQRGASKKKTGNIEIAAAR